MDTTRLQSNISNTKFSLNDQKNKEEVVENSEKSVSTSISINTNNNPIYTEYNNKLNSDLNLTYFYYSDSIKFLSESLHPFITLNDSKNCIKKENAASKPFININKINQKIIPIDCINNNSHNKADNIDLKLKREDDNCTKNVSVKEINYTVNLNDVTENDLFIKKNNDITSQVLNHKLRNCNNNQDENITNIYNFNINITYSGKNYKIGKRNNIYENNKKFNKKNYNINKYDSFTDNNDLANIKKPKEIREGDWFCPICSNINFSFRKYCNKCHFFRKNKKCEKYN